MDVTDPGSTWIRPPQTSRPVMTGRRTPPPATRFACRRARVGAVLAAVLAAVSVLAVFVSTQHASAAPPPSGLHVVKNQLVTASGTPVVLRGVDRSGSEYACIQGFGFFDGPSDAASISAMASWHINTVRVPLNEDCWLGINNAPSAYSGANYQAAITGYVSRLHAAGLDVVLDLHWTAAGTAQSNAQTDMPDADHAPAFWTSVATTFKNDTSTVFDLFNEPHDVTWTCWRDGGDCGIGYQVAGMQSLVNAVRNTGATNPVLLGGLAYANDLSQWLTYRPTDPANQEMASWHSYNFNSCNSQSCWDSQLAPVVAAVPLVTGELGENDCAHGYVDTAMAWLDNHGAGYLGWGWDTADCASFPALVSSYDGTPTAFGVGLRDHLTALATTPVPGASATTSDTPTPTASATKTAGTTPSASASPTATSVCATTGSPAPSTTTTATKTPVASPPATVSPSQTTSAAPTTNTTAPPAVPGGSLGVSPSVNTSSAPYYWEEDLDLTSSAPVTQLTVTVTVARTTGITYAGVYTTGPNGAMATGHADGSSAVTYTATLNQGTSLPANGSLRVGAQFNGNGSAHPTPGDTYTVAATVGGQRMTSTGRF